MTLGSSNGSKTSWPICSREIQSSSRWNMYFETVLPHSRFTAEQKLGRSGLNNVAAGKYSRTTASHRNSSSRLPKIGSIFTKTLEICMFRKTRRLKLANVSRSKSGLRPATIHRSKPELLITNHQNTIRLVQTGNKVGSDFWFAIFICISEQYNGICTFARHFGF